MSGRRVPLSNNTNAVNSPYRSVAAAAASKPKRSYANVQREESYGQPPPAKKQMLVSHQEIRTPPRQQSVQSSLEGRVFTRKSNTAQQSTFEKQCIAAAGKAQHAAKGEKDETSSEILRVREWQKHYRKLFPTFVFYFEGVADDVRTKYTKHVVELGARKDEFFSNAVTHVVTTRAIPPPEHHAIAEAVTSSTNDSNSQNSQPQTINPSLLDRSSESTNVLSDFGGRSKHQFEQFNNKRITNAQESEFRQQQGRNADVLYRARDLNIKIWSFDKLQRVLRVIFESEPGSQINHGHNTRSNIATAMNARAGRGVDLSQMLRNEKINGPSDRDPTVATKDISVFKGYFIYIHDMDEKLRPIMVREYTKVAHKEEGDWPQFRSVANGKCPFVGEVDHNRREIEKEKEAARLKKQQEKEKAMVPRTRAVAAFEASKMQPPKPVTGKRALSEMEQGSNRSASVSSRQANPFAPNKSFPQRAIPEASSRGNQNAFVSRAGAGRHFGGEPVASGLQPSNLTSAIRSQMISSTAAQPGAKAGTSKEVHGLQRKVLEKNSGGPGSYGLASSHRMTDISTAVKEDANTRAVRKQEKLDLIEEDIDPSEAEEYATKAEAARKVKAVQKRKLEKRDPKPGYCENCQDKFEDFEEHVNSRKHRKFAEKADNWRELDDLLSQLSRPLRESQDDY